MQGNPLTRRGLLAGATAIALAACGSASGPTQQLVDARRAYTDAQQSAAAEYSPDELLTARQALDAAERAHEADPGSTREAHLAYIATRKAQIAAEQGELEQAERAAEQAEQSYVKELERRVAEQPTETETPAAKSLPEDEEKLEMEEMEELGPPDRLEREPQDGTEPLDGLEPGEEVPLDEWPSEPPPYEPLP